MMAEPRGGDGAEITALDARRARRACVRDRAGITVAWGVWGAMTLALFLQVRHYSRNVPFADDFAMVSVMTHSEPVSLRWAWSQHNEHRPMVSRLLLAGLSRYVANDFRTARYVNAGLLSVMAAMMLVLARRLRGSARVTDAVLPLAILNIGQIESLMIGFAMNLILTSLGAIGLIVAAALRRGGDGKRLSTCLGLSLVLLPLCGGSGLTMLPPLAAWLVGFFAWGLWSGRKPGWWTRAIGVGWLVVSSAIVALYLRGYVRPAYHPPPPSLAAVGSSALMYLSLSVYPRVGTYWPPAGAIAVILLIGTISLLAIVSLRTPGERPRALGLLAILLSMLCVAGAVSVSRAGLGPGAILSSRYVTLTSPLLCVVYVAWLVYGGARARLGIHAGLLALVSLSLPPNHRFSRHYGGSVRIAARRVERSLKGHDPTAVLLTRACPALFPDSRVALERFRMLKSARLGAFSEFEEDRVASTPDATGGVRR